MTARVAIIAALPREVAGLVKGIEPDRDLRVRGIFRYDLPGAVVVAAGMGADRAALAVEAALATGEVTDLLSTGLAGSCHAGLSAGSVVEATIVVDTMTGERFQCSSRSDGELRELVLATAGKIASVTEKARLREAYQAVMVDMEAATVGRLARAHGLGFRAIKAISDDHEVELSELSNFTGKNGSFRTGAFAFHTALRPWKWRAAIGLGRNSSAAISGLEQALKLTFAVHKAH